MTAPAQRSATPLVTIITPTYNHQDYIGACIDSVLAQSYPHWEQVIVDDGSTDHTAEVVQRHADPRVRLVRQENRGLLRLAETYNDVLSATTGSLVAILEGDDLWPVDRLERLVHVMQDQSVGLAYGRTQLTTAAGRPVDRFYPDAGVARHPGALSNDPVGAAAAAMADPAVRTFTFPCSVLIRRSALDDIGGFQSVEGLPFTDYPTFLELALRHRFAYVHEVTGYWRQLRGSGTRVRDEMDTHARMDALVDRRFMDPPDLTRASLPGSADLAARRADRMVKARFDMGRRHALHGRWADARREFARAVIARNGRSYRFRLAAAAGWVATLGRRDIEYIVGRLAGRQHDLRHLYG